MDRTTLRRAALTFAGFTAVALLLAGQRSVSNLTAGRSSTFGGVVPGELVFWWTWAALTPAIVALSRRYPVEPRHWWRVPAIHLPASLIFGLVVFLAIAAIVPLFYFKPSLAAFRDVFVSRVTWQLWVNVLVYALIAAVAHAVLSHRAAAQRELRASQLEARLAHARLAALRAQLQPHFLFNTLNGIAALVREDARRADRMIASLGELLRHSLDDQREEVPVREEVAFVARYVELQKIRFEERLHVSFDVDPAVADEPVPSFVLQPLVENAIRHALGAGAGPAAVEVSVVPDEGWLRLAVRDTGPGLAGPEGAAVRLGVGLGSTLERLRQLYGERYRFELRNAAPGGVEASIRLPLVARPEPAPDAGARGVGVVAGPAP